MKPRANGMLNCAEHLISKVLIILIIGDDAYTTKSKQTQDFIGSEEPAHLSWSAADIDFGGFCLILRNQLYSGGFWKMACAAISFVKRLPSLLSSNSTKPWLWKRQCWMIQIWIECLSSKLIELAYPSLIFPANMGKRDKGEPARASCWGRNHSSICTAWDWTRIEPTTMTWVLINGSDSLCSHRV